jgi:hypothetical protein
MVTGATAGTSPSRMVHLERSITGRTNANVLSARTTVLGDQSESTVVRMSVPARTALVTGVFSAISASFLRW